MLFLIITALTLNTGVLMISAKDQTTNSGENVAAFDQSKDAKITKSIVLTREQAIKRLSEVKNISIAEAQNIIDARKSSSTEGLRGTAAQMYYIELIVEHDFGAGYTVEVGCLASTYNSYGPFLFNDIIEKWTIATGSGSYTWTEAYKTAQLNSPAYSVYLTARGAIEVEVDISTSAGVEFGSELAGAQFTISRTMGTKYYYRKVESWSGTAAA